MRAPAPFVLLIAAALAGCPGGTPTKPVAGATKAPTVRKTATPKPADKPTERPTDAPTVRPSATATPTPAATPTATPTPLPTLAPLTVSTYAGAGPVGLSGGGVGEGAVDVAKFSFPQDVTAAPDGTVYVADTPSNRIRKIKDGVVSTLAGRDKAGAQDGSGFDAAFDHPIAVACDAAGDVYVADALNARIRKVTAAGVVTTVAGTSNGFADGPKATAQFDRPSGVAVDSKGIVYVADTYNNRIRKIFADGTVETIAGGGQPDVGAFADGTGGAARFYRPHDLVLKGDDTLYVADAFNHCIRQIALSGDRTAVVTTLAGAGVPNAGTENGEYKDAKGREARFFRPQGLGVAPNGDLYVADQLNHRVRVIRADGTVQTVAGAQPDTGDGGYREGDAVQALFAQPYGLFVLPDLRILVADTGNSKIRLLAP